MDEGALFDELVSIARERQAAVGAPGVGLGVLTEGATRTTGLGVVDVREDRAVTPDTLFRLCSVTKPFTATLILSLVDRGLLALDEPVVTYVPTLQLADRNAVGSLTVRRLLTHTGGFEGEVPTEDLRAYGTGDDAIERVVADYGKLRQWVPPGEAFGYCNTGYWLLGAIAARVTGTTFEEAMRTQVLAPLGLDHTCISSDDAILHRVALPHHRREKGSTEQRVDDRFGFPRCRVPSGGLLSSIDDLLRFAAFHLGDGPPDADVLSDASRLAMQEPLVPSGHGEAQGLGWSLRRSGDGWVVWHDGSYAGYASALALIPSKRFALAVLVNSDDGHKVWEPVLKAALERLAGIPSPERRVITLSDDDLGRFDGRYAMEEWQEVVVQASDGGLGVTLQRVKGGQTTIKDEWRCAPLSPTEFRLVGDEDEDTVIEFLPGPSGAARAIRLWGRLGALVEDR